MSVSYQDKTKRSLITRLEEHHQGNTTRNSNYETELILRKLLPHYEF